MEDEINISVPGRDASRELAAELERLGGAARGRRLRILVASIFRQRVSLSRAQAAGLSPRNLENALFYEIEPFSGLSRAEGTIAWAEVDSADASRTVYDVVHAPNALIASLVKAAAAAKCQIAGISSASPAGAGSSAFDDGAIAWIAPKSRGGGCKGWKIAYAVLLAVLAILAALHAWVSVGDLRLLEADVEKRGQMQRDLESRSRALRSIEAERDAILESRRKAEAAQREVAALRRANADLLRAIASSWGDVAVVRSIVPYPREDDLGVASVEISASAIDAARAMEASTRLQSRLAQRGWKVYPGSVSGAAGTASFTVRCEFSPSCGGAQ